MRKIFAALMIVSVMSLVLAGCSKGEGDAKPADAKTDTKPATDADKK